MSDKGTTNNAMMNKGTQYKPRKITCFIMMMVLVAGIFAGSAQRQQAHAFSAIDDPVHYQGLLLAIKENWVAALMMMTEQFTTTMMMQMMIVGTFMDAQQNLETIRLYRELTAQAHKDLHPSIQMCMFGTSVRSLASSDLRGQANTKMLDQIMEKRELLTRSTISAGGIKSDYIGRIDQFRNVFCDLDEMNQQVNDLCDGTAGPLSRQTQDVDFASAVGLPFTIDVNFADAAHTDREKDIIALSRNLYAPTTFDFMPEEVMNETTALTTFMETRSVHAMRSVARYSFANIVGLKSEGDDGNIYESAPFIKAIVSELGIPDAEINNFLGENPSYYAQMEVLTKKMYQSPEFYTNLYDKPQNVKRIGVAIQAMELMQNRDRYEAALRREMLVAMMAELKIRKYQERVNTKIFNAISVVNDEPMTP
jgi:hypothetical protein